MLNSVNTRMPRTLQGVFDTLGPRPRAATHSSGTIFPWYAESLQERQKVTTALGNIAWNEFHHRLVFPPVPLTSANAASGRGGEPAEVLQQQLADYDAAIINVLQQCPYFGRVQYTGPHECVFTYFDAKKTHGLLQTTHRIQKHQHDLVQARQRKLTDRDVNLPAKQQRIVRALPESIHPQLRVITGILIVMRQQDAGTISHDHAVGRTLRQAGRAAWKYGPGAGAAMAGGVVGVGMIAGVVSAIKAVAAAAAVVAVADPALVLGDLVISGWIEPQE